MTRPTLHLSPVLLHSTAVHALEAQMDGQEAVRVVRVSLREALLLDDRETVLEARAFALLATVQDPVAEEALDLLLEANELDRKQRVKDELALRQAGLGSDLLRRANGLLDRALLGLRTLLRIGRKGAARTAPLVGSQLTLAGIHPRRAE